MEDKTVELMVRFVWVRYTGPSNGTLSTFFGGKAPRLDLTIEMSRSGLSREVEEKGGGPEIRGRA